MADELLPQELRILVAVADSGGFTAAAERLGLTQSAVSHAVRGCERKLGAVLFERGRRGATPTPAGERVAGHARRILRLLAALPAEARQGAGGAAAAQDPSGPVRIVAFRSAAVRVLPAVLAELGSRYPQVKPEVRVVRDLGRGTAGEVADGRADLALATLGTVPAGLLAVPLYREDYALAHQQGHPDPRSLPLVDWDENCGSYTAAWWRRQDWIPPATINVSDDTVVLSLAAQGLGMAIVPRLSLDRPPAGLAVTDLGPDRPSRQVGYVTTPELARTAAVRAVIRVLRDAPLPEGATAVTEHAPDRAAAHAPDRVAAHAPERTG